MTSLFTMVIARDSSMRQLRRKFLVNDHGSSSGGNFVVTAGNKVLLHHDVWHEVLQKVEGLQHSDILYEGKMYIVQFTRIVVSFKSTRPYGMPGNEAIQLLNVVDREIEEFLDREVLTKRIRSHNAGRKTEEEKRPRTT